MNERSVRKTLLIYLCLALLFSSVLSIIVLMVEYHPFNSKTADRFGLGVIILNSVVWNLILTVLGSLSFINLNPFVRGHYLLSFLSFILAPLVTIAAILILVPKIEDLFAFAESAVCFLLVQIFYFFKFRKCISVKHSSEQF